MGISVPTLPESTVQRLRIQHECIATIIGSQPEELLRQRPSPDKWSIVENIAHLLAYQQIFVKRVKRILTEESPAIAAYVGDHDPFFLEAAEQRLADLLTDIATDRQYLYEWITSLNGNQLSRRAAHSRYGSRTLLSWTEFFLLHEAHHCNTIWKLSVDNTWA
jgi:hypothetical protein